VTIQPGSLMRSRRQSERVPLLPTLANRMPGSILLPHRVLGSQPQAKLCLIRWGRNRGAIAASASITTAKNRICCMESAPLGCRRRSQHGALSIALTGKEGDRWFSPQCLMQTQWDR
jgi:hypothetical protein